MPKGRKDTQTRIAGPCRTAVVLLLLAGVAALTAESHLGRLVAPAVSADFTYFNFSAGDLTQDWSNRDLITQNDDWSKVPSIAGFRGGNGEQPYNVDPRTILRNFSFAQVAANIRPPSTPSGYNTGGVVEFDQIPDPTVGINATTTADSPHLVIYLDTRGRRGVTVEYDLRDIDCSNDDNKKRVVTQYRVRRPDAPADPREDTTPWRNVTMGVNTYIPDATDPGTCDKVTRVVAKLSKRALNQPRVEVRILTTNLQFVEELIGIDNIRVTSAGAR